MNVAFYRLYMRLKIEYENCILLMRSGDFYEAFNEDAEIVAQICNTVLTSRLYDGVRVPLVGLPCHSALDRLQELALAGHTVALAEQVAAPPTADDKVSRIITNDRLIKE